MNLPPTDSQWNHIKEFLASLQYFFKPDREPDREPDRHLRGMRNL